jgi:hypothetical protein
MIRPEWLNTPWTKVDEKRLATTLAENLCTTRFNNKTYAENKIGRLRLNIECFYANPSSMRSVKGNQIMYVLELNVEENKIMGIGRVPNTLNGDVYQIYGDESYNKRYFSGVYRIDPEELKTEEDRQLFAALENICFRGRGHLKRGHRMLCFPKKIIGQCLQHNFDIISEINKIFLRKYSNTTHNTNK